jgi:hypothetical protein
MVNIIFDTETGLVTEEGMPYSIASYEDLGADIVHLYLEKEGQTLVKCYMAGDCKVNEVPKATVAELLVAVGNPPLLEVPED